MFVTIGLLLLITAVAGAYLSVRARVLSALEERQAARRAAERQQTREHRQREACDQVMRQFQTR